MGILSVFLFASYVIASTTDYRILGLDPGADLDAVRSAYRVEALRWHPDRNSDPEASDRFVALSAAYERIKSSSRNDKHVEVDPFKTFKEFMGGSFSFSFTSGNVKMAGTSTSTSSVIQNGKRITKTVVKDLSTGESKTTRVEEDLKTGLKSTHIDNSHSIEL